MDVMADFFSKRASLADSELTHDAKSIVTAILVLADCVDELRFEITERLYELTPEHDDEEDY